MPSVVCAHTGMSPTQDVVFFFRDFAFLIEGHEMCRSVETVCGHELHQENRAWNRIVPVTVVLVTTGVRALSPAL